MKETNRKYNQYINDQITSFEAIRNHIISFFNFYFPGTFFCANSLSSLSFDFVSNFLDVENKDPLFLDTRYFTTYCFSFLKSISEYVVLNLIAIRLNRSTDLMIRFS